MIRFNNDYNRGCHPAVLEALAAHNGEAYPGYGLDPWCQRAAELVRGVCENDDVAVHFFTGATQANFAVISHALRPYQGVICAETGHINAHETGAPEHTGHKMLALPHVNGKITAEQVEREAVLFETSPVAEHIVMPKMVYISLPTEFGTVYSLEELEALSSVCRNHGLYLFVDGARLGYALGSGATDITAADLARLTDAFYFGGTKCGAMFGEALVIANPEINEHFRSSIKQNGGMLAKGWLTGLQFATLLQDGLYFDICGAAVSRALRIRDAFVAAGISTYIDSPTNQQFFVVDDAQQAALACDFFYEPWEELDDGRHVIRFCASWATTDEEVDALVEAVRQL